MVSSISNQYKQFSGLFDLHIRPWQLLVLRFREAPKIMVMKSWPHREPELEPHHRKQLSIIPRITLFREYNSYSKKFGIFKNPQIDHCPVGLGSRIHRLHLCREVRPLPTARSVLDMTLNNLMVRIQLCCRGFEEYRVTLYCHRSRVHSSPE